MKYIISEDKVSGLLRKIVEEHGLSKALSITGLNVISLFDKIGPILINSDLANDLILELFENDLLKYKIHNYTITSDRFEGTLRWNYYNPKTQERMYALCTPFWDGNDYLPIDIEGYTKGDYEDWSENQKILPAPRQFNSLNALIDWYNNDYISTMKSVLHEYLKEYRKEYKKESKVKK